MGPDSPRRLWPWLLGVAVAAAAVWLGVVIVDRRGPPDPQPAAEGAIGPEAAPGGPQAEEAERAPVGAAAAGKIQARVDTMRAAVRRYEEECVGALEAAVGSGIAEVTSGCIDRLSHAVDAMVASDTVGGVIIGERLQQFRERVDSVRNTPPGSGRAGPTRRVLVSAAEVLRVIRDQRYPESAGEDADLGDAAMADLRQAAEAIEPEMPLRRQQNRLQRFFLAADAILTAMARPGISG